ncbi:MAG TPA: T9SS type A sorting domain-containing protein [Ignavibacteria bacterium]|nr:T9SS type A sorting domain-containing protein [Ignavibacteria bacterium]
MKSKSYILKLIILIVMFAFVNNNSSKAALDSKGTDFWLMFNGNVSAPTITLFITSNINTSGNVSIPGLAFSVPFNVTANVVTSVVLPSSVATHTSNVVDNKGIHVTSLDEVTVYGLNYAPFTTDAYLGLPTDILGTDYTVLSYKNTSGNGVQFGVVGTVNATTVTITPSVTTGPRIAGIPYNIILNQGDTYELTNSSGTSDLSGTTITSNQPIGVMGSNRCANIPGGFAFCDHICEMIPPNSTFGQNFVTVPLASRTNGDTWRILASQNSTVVNINGVAQPAINAGQFIETVLTGQSTINSDKPILVAQYSNGSSFSGNPGDPFMMIIPSYEQYLANYTLSTVTGYVAHYINVVAPNAIVGSLTLDGAPVPVIEFTPIGVTGFSGAQIAVTPGSHTLDGSLPFGAFQYGFNTDDSYGYPGGLNLAPIATVSSLDVTPETSTRFINTQHCVDGLVLDQNNAPVVGVRVDYLVSGVNPGAGFAFTNGSGIAQYCYTGINIGKDTIIGSTGNLVDTVLVTWDDPLPVELNSFVSMVSEKNVTLSWTTSSEINNSGFDIERSSLNLEWAKVGSVNGNGTTLETKNYIFTDKNLNSGVYNYRLKQIDYNGNFEYYNLENEVIIGLPNNFTLLQNYPNPFNPSTKIEFNIPADGNVKLSVYDINGKLVSVLTDGNKTAGYYTVDFNGSGLSSGIYFYKIEFNGISKVMKMSLLK